MSKTDLNEKALEAIKKRWAPVDPRAVASGSAAQWANVTNEAITELNRLLDICSDSNALLVNMMRGSMPKIHAGSLYKLYTEDELRAALRALGGDHD